ncbi:MAG: whiA [Clostridiales bacterium]|jgi:DNA-binding protein WhiA|nr:whiA [Clostridiales bacterium]
MSFSSNVKDELSKQFSLARHCHIAEISAIIGFCGYITVFGKERAIIRMQTENLPLAKKFFTLLEKTFNIKAEILVRAHTGGGKNRTYIIVTNDEVSTMKLLLATRLVEVENNQLYVLQGFDTLVTQAVCCKRAFIRGAFLATGSVLDPEKTYHLEIVCSDDVTATYVQELIKEFDLDAKIVQRKKYFVVYVKEGSQIVDLLNIMEAHVALMDLENIRILKEMKNILNRKVNCETANIKKTVSAAVKLNSDIEYIDKTMGISSLPELLEDIARYRLENGELSLKELGQLLDPPVGKSGVNHRLRKISAIAQKLREEREG